MKFENVVIEDNNFSNMDEIYCAFFFCPKCGDNEITEGINFCPMCGVKIEFDIDENKY